MRRRSPTCLNSREGSDLPLGPLRSAGSGEQPVRVEPLGVELVVLPGETLIEAAWRAGYQWPTVCYGQARCMACQVVVLDGLENVIPPGEEELAAMRTLLGGRGLRNRRLACRLEVTGPVVVEKPGVRKDGAP
jgi:2Fe-2S ferredoxin